MGIIKLNKGIEYLYNKIVKPQLEILNYRLAYLESQNSIPISQYTAKECYEAFYEEMAATAKAIRMSEDIEWISASGMTNTGNKITVRDQANLAYAVSQNSKVLEWCSYNETVNFTNILNRGKTRDVQVSGNIIFGNGDFKDSGYELIGGKGGSLSYDSNNYKNKNFVYFIKKNNSDEKYVLTFMTKTRKNKDNINFYKQENCYTLSRVLFDKFINNNYDENSSIKITYYPEKDKPEIEKEITKKEFLEKLIEDGGGYCVYKISTTAPDFNDTDNVMSDGLDVKNSAASVTKLLTALVVSKYYNNHWNKKLKIYPIDIEVDKDKYMAYDYGYNIEDAMKACLMKSSNNLARVLSREIGEVIKISKESESGTNIPAEEDTDIEIDDTIK